MDLVEVRELEGPNLFILEPAIKIEVHSTAVRQTVETAPHPYAPSNNVPDEVLRLASLTRDVLAVAGLPDCPVTTVPMEIEGNFSIVFPWSDRRIARLVARAVKSAIGGETIDLGGVQESAGTIRQTEPSLEDRPVMIEDEQRSAVTIAVTGTNGKTTTTRLLAHIFRNAGQSVGWSSSSGVYINGEEVLTGDYSGPRGAERVLTDPEVDVAIVETARGGILLRGVVCQSVDVSVFTNISPDHLDLQGVRTVEGLAWAKGVITRITRSDGYAVLNASDPLVMDATRDIRAQKFLISTDPTAPELLAHGASGLPVMTVIDGNITLIETGIPTTVLPVADVPHHIGRPGHVHGRELALRCGGRPGGGRDALPGARRSLVVPEHTRNESRPAQHFRTSGGTSHCRFRAQRGWTRGIARVRAHPLRTGWTTDRCGGYSR
ncbi:MAG: Mur ligase family protein [Thermomicrobiales bacterium]